MTAENESHPEFWKSAGVHLLRRNADGRLAVTDDFLRAYLLRPEMQPVEESCAAEIALHEALLAEPRRRVSPDELAALADADARENYEVVLGFRERLIGAGTLEDCYIALFDGTGPTVPPLFIDQLVQAILRSALDGCTDPLRLRAAELLFRSQKVTLRDGSVMAADEETVEMYATTGGFGALGRLLVEAQTPTRRVELDVLDESNADLYWDRSDRYDTVLDLSFGRPGLDALCRVLEAWVAHLLAVEVSVQPVQSIRDERWVWHVGLDPEANGILNDLYNGAEVGEDRLGRLLSLFRLEFRDTEVMLPAIAGRPVYLGMAMTEGSVLKLKPQNLLFNLPLVAAA
ncbi:MAG: DUF6352 family protein [Alphaproteobacteria bacterium]|nr:DUF6352 family protein [Alphaproteobacteria bacterium]